MFDTTNPQLPGVCTCNETCHSTMFGLNHVTITWKMMSSGPRNLACVTTLLCLHFMVVTGWRSTTNISLIRGEECCNGKFV